MRHNPDPADARGAIMRVTEDRLRLGAAIARASSQVADVLAALMPAAQADLLSIQVTLIRQLQLVGAIPVQRMCVSCRHFRPHALRARPTPINAPSWTPRLAAGISGWIAASMKRPIPPPRLPPGRRSPRDRHPSEKEIHDNGVHQRTGPRPRGGGPVLPTGSGLRA